MGCSFAWQRAENRTFVLLSCFYQQCTNIVLVLVSASHLICISALFFFWKQRKSFDLIWLRWHTVRFLGAKIVLFVCLFYWSILINMNEYPYCNVGPEDKVYGPTLVHRELKLDGAIGHFAEPL